MFHALDAFHDVAMKSQLLLQTSPASICRSLLSSRVQCCRGSSKSFTVVYWTGLFHMFCESTWTQLLVGCMDSEMAGFCTCKCWPRPYQLPKKPPEVYRNQARLADWLSFFEHFLGKTPGNQRRKEPGLGKNVRSGIML